MMRKFIPLAALALGLLVQTSPIPLRVWDLEPAGLTPAVLPTRTVPVEPATQVDFNRDGLAERLVLANGRLRIATDSGTVWESPSDWTVLQAGISDLNRDGKPEAVLLVWRPFHPWPVDQWLPHGGRIADFHDNEGNSCHIILIGWRDSQYREMWAGSALAEPVRSFAVADLNGDNLQELVTLEGSYADFRLSTWVFGGSTLARALKVWEWNGFGFSVVSSIAGTFDKLALVRAENGLILILSP
jgi:hypothetical protein